jgi:hypothetical protein
VTFLLALALALVNDGNLVSNPGFESAVGTSPASFELKGQATYMWTGYSDEVTSAGVGLTAYDPKGAAEGSVSQTITGIDQGKGKWLRFAFRGLAEDNFKLKSEQLFMKLEFLAKGVSRDSAERLIYREVDQDRRDLAANGNGGKGGASVWRTYEFEELIPFPEVDSVRLTVGFKGGAVASADLSTFIMDDWVLSQASLSERGFLDPTAKKRAPRPVAVTTEGMPPARRAMVLSV